MVLQRKSLLLVIALALCSGVALGISMPTMGLFLDPLRQQFDSSHSQAAQPAAAYLLSFQVGGALVGWLLERAEVRLVMTVGAVLVALGYLAASVASALPQIATAMALVGLGVSACTYVPSMVLAARWVAPPRRGLAIGLIIGAASLGGSIFVPAVQAVLGEVGWRAACQWIAVFVLATVVPAVVFGVRERRGSDACADESADVDSAAAPPRAQVCSRAYVMLALMMVLANLALMGVLFHVVPFLTDSGLSAQIAAALYAVTSISSVGGYVAVGMIADRVGAHRTLLLCLVLNAASICVLLPAGDAAGTVWPALVFVIAWGATVGASGQLFPILLLESTGPRRFGALLGIAGLVSGMLSSVGPVATGAIHDRTGSYAAAFALYAVLTLAAILPTLLARRDRRVPLRNAT